jgi:hypothetical protein
VGTPPHSRKVLSPESGNDPNLVARATLSSAFLERQLSSLSMREQACFNLISAVMNAARTYGAGTHTALATYLHDLGVLGMTGDEMNAAIDLFAELQDVARRAG